MRKIIVTLSLLGSFVFPSSALAFSTGVPFGGLVVAAVPCTCTPQGGFWIEFTPFWSGLPVPATGALYYPFPPSSLLYAYFQPGVPATFELGEYLPGGGGAEQCWTGVPPACTILPTLGAVEYEGTSSLAPISIFDF